MTTMTQDQSVRERGWLLTEIPATIVAADAATMPDWLAAIRRDAFTRFADRGLPGPRDEPWRRTNLRPIRETAFQRPDADVAISSSEVGALSLPLDGAMRLVFINGRFNEAFSDTQALPAGVTVQTIRAALADDPSLLQAHLTQYANDADDPFITLNTALIDDGVVVHVAAGVTVETPIYLLNITTATGGPIMTHPRNLIVAESGAHATVVEDYVGTDGEVYLTNAVTELVVGREAHLHHYYLERESESAYNVSTLTAHHETNSTLSSHTVLLGGALVRNNVNPVLDGEQCHSLLNGLYIGRERQHLDNLMRVEHRQPNGESRQFYKGILADASQGVFAGRIIVSRAAQKTDAVQSNQSLLLSDTAQATSMPQLEIYADDVKCTHGATIGELDEDAMFYLRSRGISADEARGILVRAFAGESLDRMNLEPLQRELERLLLRKLSIEPGSTE